MSILKSISVLHKHRSKIFPYVRRVASINLILTQKKISYVCLRKNCRVQAHQLCLRRIYFFKTENYFFRTLDSRKFQECRAAVSLFFLRLDASYLVRILRSPKIVLFQRYTSKLWKLMLLLWTKAVTGCSTDEAVLPIKRL